MEVDEPVTPAKGRGRGKRKADASPAAVGCSTAKKAR
jgi:hypothetical protein